MFSPSPSDESAQPIPDLSPVAPRGLIWLDQLKGLALLWIILNHGAETIFGAPMFSNPHADWPPLADRLTQLMPIDGFGWLNLPLNLIRYVGWMGDQGVQLFLIASGFGLTWSLLKRRSGVAATANPSPFSWRDFYRRRLLRLYPLWWMSHLLLLGLLTLTDRGDQVSLLDPKFYLSLLGLRVTIGTFYYIVPSWWFIGLLLQLYALFPLLWLGLQRWGPTRLLLITSAIALPIRGVGLYWTSDYLDLWSRGSICVTRLPEFVLGMSLAAWFDHYPHQTAQFLRSGRTQLAAIGIYLLGLITAFSLLGMTVSPFLLGVGGFGLCYGGLTAIAQLDRHPGQILAWVGRHSYALFLMQHVFIKAFVLKDQISLRSFAGFAIAIVVIGIVGIGLERVTDRLSRWSQFDRLAGKPS
jgi:peptidoglycan/LPS O-acetylase OafA/YrhL